MNKKVKYENKYETQTSVQDISYTGYQKDCVENYSNWH